MVVLTQTNSKLCFSEVRDHIKHHLTSWNNGQFQALVDDADCTCCQFITHGDRQTPTTESKARAFNGLVQSGHLRQVVHHLTSREGGGVLHPDTLDAKTSRKVSAVLMDKHPPSCHPPIEALEAYKEALEPLWLQIGFESFEAAIWKLAGNAGPSSTDAVELQHWLFRFGTVSETLTAELIAWTEWLANNSPPWAGYHAMMACCLIAIDKQPGVCPVGIGEVYRCLFAKAVIAHTSSKAAFACGSTNLCAGLPAGIEGAVHALAKDYAHKGRPPIMEASDKLATPPSSPGLTQASTPRLLTQPLDEDAYAIVLIDVRNGFNKLNRHAMLWTIQHHWPSGSWFAFNCY